MNQNIPRLLAGISRTLNIANQIIPIYQDTKPLFNNARNIYTLIKNNNHEEINKTKEIKKETIKVSSNIPQFFI